MDFAVLQHMVDCFPGGRWAVGVSGGADSVALLHLLHRRADLSLHVVHLDHQTRAGESANDAAFVADLSAKLGLECTVKCRSEVEVSMENLLRNLPNRFRQARLALFRRVVETNQLNGVILRTRRTTRPKLF